MGNDSKSGTVAFDRRQVYRPFLERLNPIGSPNADLIITRSHDPRSFGEPPIHVAFANAAELSRGMQMALVGGIGSGKTTELLLTQKVLSRHSDAVNISVDLSDYTDLNEINTGAILATAGMRLYSKLLLRPKKSGEGLPEDVKRAHAWLREVALGKTKWVPEVLEAVDEDPGMVRVEVPGLMRLRFPALRRKVAEVQELFLFIAAPLL